MKDLAPEIFRQRLLIEGIYTVSVDENAIKKYFDFILNQLKLTTYKEPIIHSSDGVGKKENQGFEAFVPLIESGIALYTWEKNRFFSIVLFTCKKFNKNKAIRLTQDFFQAAQLETKEF